MQAYYPYRSEQARSEYLASYDRMAKSWPAPAESRMVPTSWGETLVRVSGPASAPPLVLLPGINTSSLIWEPNIAALSTQFRSYAVDRNSANGVARREGAEGRDKRAFRIFDRPEGCRVEGIWTQKKRAGMYPARSR
jgi:pimeloyl-ACP methyl ester carboxylesterase